MSKRAELTGTKHNKLTVIRFDICSCGNKGIVRSQDLVDGKSKS